MDHGVFLFVALFALIFGQIFLARIIDIAFDLVDKAIENMGSLIKLPFRLAAIACMCFLKALVWALKKVVQLAPERKVEVVQTVVQTLEVTPLTLQHLRNQRFLNAQPKVRQGLLIEQSPD